VIPIARMGERAVRAPRSPMQVITHKSSLPLRRAFLARIFALLAIPCALLGASMSFPASASASVIDSQLTTNTYTSQGLPTLTQFLVRQYASTTRTIQGVSLWLGDIYVNEADTYAILWTATSSGYPISPLATSTNWVSAFSLATTTAEVQFTFNDIVIQAGQYYFLGIAHSGVNPSCGNSCVTVDIWNAGGKDAYDHASSPWFHESNNWDLKYKLQGVQGSEFQTIIVDTPANGSQINDVYTPVVISYSNPEHFNQIYVCEWDPDTLSQHSGGNPCIGGGSTWSIGSSGTIEYTFQNLASSSHMVISAGFGLTFDYIPSGIRYQDYDYSSIGFYTISANSVATSTPDSFSKYGGLDCGGLNLVDNLKCAGIFLFIPDYDFTHQMELLADDLASTTPFGYVADLVSSFEGYASAGTSSLTVSIELSSIMNFLGGNFGTTSITVLSGDGLRSTMGSTMWNMSQNLMIGMMWLGFLIYVYRRSIHLL